MLNIKNLNRVELEKKHLRLIDDKKILLEQNKTLKKDKSKLEASLKIKKKNIKDLNLKYRSVIKKYNIKSKTKLIKR